MARDVVDSTPIESRAELIEALEKGCKPHEAFRIGTEHEKFGFTLANHQPVPYEGPAGIGEILRQLQARLGWDAITDGDALIGLADPVNGGAISLEPGGQLELSGAPLATLHETAAETATHLGDVKAVADALGVGFLGLGVCPTWTRADVPTMPKSRYDIMTRYMPKVGSLGLDMMYRSSTIQVNLDFASEADMVKKMRVGLALQPIATALFANSPFLNGRPNGFLSFRSEIWRHTDPDRTGMLPFVFEEGFSFERYVDYALDVPLYFVKRGDTYHDVAGQSFRDLLEGRLASLPGERAIASDWENHLTTIFPEMRMKRYMEMRGADGGSTDAITALSAFWVGLLYDQSSLDAAWDLVKDWSAADRAALRASVPQLGLASPIAGKTVREIAETCLDLSRNGLKNRGNMNSANVDESSFLSPLEEIVTHGITPAERLLDLYNSDWQGDLSHLFNTMAY